MDDSMHHPGAGAPGLRARVLEERQVSARPRVLVSVEQVVDGRVVLVDRLGGQPQAEDPGVEVDVAAGVAGARPVGGGGLQCPCASFLSGCGARVVKVVVYATIGAS